MAPKFLKNRTTRVLLTLAVIATGVLLSVYYVQIAGENTIAIPLTDIKLNPGDSKVYLIGAVLVVGLLLSGLINILFADAHDVMKDTAAQIPPPSEKIIEKHFIPTLDPAEHTAEPKALDQFEPVDLKFYPVDFLPDFKYFVGREELLKKLEATLENHHRASIHDISGLGKTFSSQRYADLNREKYEKIFFINAAKESYLDSMADIAVMLMPELAQNDNQQERALGLKAWLEKYEEWLVIYDNVDEPAVLRPFIPSSLNGDCIFTSNFRAMENITPHRIEIDELEPEFARVLLYSRAKSKPESQPEFSDDAERQAFENLINGIDGLPIALLTTGAIINRDQLSFAEFWEMFQKANEVVLEAVDEFGDYKKKSALRAFSIALDDISKDSKNDTKAIKAEKAAVREMLNAACFPFPDDIPEEFLQAFLKKNLTGFDLSDKMKWIALRNRFSNFDLFKFDSTAKSFATHRLIQKCIFSRLSDSEKKTYAEKVLNNLEDLFPEYDYTNKEQCEMYYQHTLTVLENTDRIGFEAGVSHTLHDRVGKYQYKIGNLKSAEEFHGKSLKISKSFYGKEAVETATSLNELALVYTEQGKYDEAIWLYKQVIEIDEKTIGKEHHNYAKHLNNLALVYDSQGKYDEAIELCKKAIEIGEKTVGKEHHDHATRLNNLAGVYDSQGKYDEAIRLYKQAMEITGKALGKEHPAYATRLNNLAWVYRSQEKYSEATPLFEEALRILEAKLPPEHPKIANVKVSIAFCNSKMVESE